MAARSASIPPTCRRLRPRAATWTTKFRFRAANRTTYREAAMSDVQELKRHIRWLEDKAEWDDGIGDTVDEINSRLDAIGQNINGMIDTINNHAAVLKDV